MTLHGGTESDCGVEGGKVEGSGKSYKGFPAGLLFGAEKAELQHRTYSVLQGWADMMREVPSSVFDSPKTAMWNLLVKLFKWVFDTFAREDIHWKE